MSTKEIWQVDCHYRLNSEVQLLRRFIACSELGNVSCVGFEIGPSCGHPFVLFAFVCGKDYVKSLDPIVHMNKLAQLEMISENVRLRNGHVHANVGQRSCTRSSNKMILV